MARDDRARCSRRRATRSSPVAGRGSWRPPTAAARRAAACRSAATSSCPMEQGLNPYVDLGVEFRYFFARKVDVREVRRRVRHLARRLRDARRAVRGADADPDRQGPGLPGDPDGQRLLGRAARLDPRARSSPSRRSTSPTWTCCASPTTRPRRATSSMPMSAIAMGAARRPRTRRGRRPGRGRAPAGATPERAES